METLPKAIWLTRFGRCLMRLQPSMTAVKAAQQSVTAFRTASDVWPERAAERLSEALVQQVAEDAPTSAVRIRRAALSSEQGSQA